MESMMINETRVQKQVKDTFLGFPTSYENIVESRLQFRDRGEKAQLASKTDRSILMSTETRDKGVVGFFNIEVQEDCEINVPI